VPVFFILLQVFKKEKMEDPDTSLKSIEDEDDDDDDEEVC